MEDYSKTRSATANGFDVSLKPSVGEETYNKVHHDLDVAAAHRKPIVTESKYKVKVAEPGVETLPLADHDHVEGHRHGHDHVEGHRHGYDHAEGHRHGHDHAEGNHHGHDHAEGHRHGHDHAEGNRHGHDHAEGNRHGHVDRKSERTTVTRTSQTTTEKPKATEESQKGQFIAKPDVYSEKSLRGEEDGDDDDDEGGINLLPLLGGVVAIAGVIAGVMFYRKRNPDVDVKIRRSVEEADSRVKGAFGSGERKVKELFGSSREKFNNLIHRGEREVQDDDYENYDNHDHGHGHSLNPLNVFDSGSYQVKQGDNMTKIARNNGKKSWHEIADKNPSIRNPDRIYPGDRLKL